ncbi:MAG: aspartate 1-decarboxylase [Ignavibacteriae bacterium]|nr:aspartate 1-decarboxylase [Ignavibacteriota bacterium]MCB9215917.1 aspartate 1-decarboxylase [Ignavibacteria bacterium]
MQRFMFKAKIHRATITQADLNYEGSLSIDQTLLEAADILPYEKVAVVNITNGERLETYAIPAEPGSGVICLNGAAARKGSPGDLIIIMTYGMMSEEEARAYRPTVVHVDRNNKMVEVTHEQVAGKEYEYV